MTVAAGSASLVEGEFALTAEDFRHIAQVLHSHAGIALGEGKAALVYSRLARRLRALGLRSFREYCALIDGVDGVDERQAMTAALPTNVTRFYREPHHFEDLLRRVMPRLAETARAGGRVRRWSAACSNGQEPYSMALTVLAALPEAAELDVRILASDSDPNLVAEGAAGAYSEETLAAAPETLWRRHFDRAPGGRGDLWRAGAALRRLVAFRELNLIGDWPMKGRFDVSFCRNVAIYFDDATQERVWSRFTPLMNPGATLYIGHSERVLGPAAAQLRPDGLTTYRLGGAA